MLCVQLINNQLTWEIKKKQMKERQGQWKLQEKSSKRRMTTDCNYSVLSTLLMRFLKEKDKEAYRLSRDLARRNKISQEKNYSVIFLRIALFLHRKTQENLNWQQVVQELFEWLQIQVDDCVNSKYKDNQEDFKKLIKKRNREILSVMKRVFKEGDLRNPFHIKELVISIYEKKGNEYTKTHEKMASNLASLIVGIVSKGDQYQEEQEELIKLKKSFTNVGTLSDFSGNSYQNPPDLASTLVDSSSKAMEQLENLCSQNQLNFYSSRSLEYGFEEPTSLIDLSFFQNFEQPTLMMMEVDSPGDCFFLE